MFLRTILFLLTICLISPFIFTQDETNLDFFIKQANENAQILNKNDNLLKIGEIQNSITTVQNKTFQVGATSLVLVILKIIKCISL